jgi:hypothetical protein
MGVTNNSFNIIGLDFDETKDSLKAYLSTQETLKDYNFDGSVLSTILDVLAYNTHYQAFYANMVANEMFLDSAILRPSVVSHAKALGYVPASKRAAYSVMNLKIADSENVTENTYLSRGSVFRGIDPAGIEYRFVLLDTVYANSQTRVFENVKAYEGTLRRISYIYNPNVKQASYLLMPNDKIDTSTIRVRVQNSPTDVDGFADTWTLATSYIDLTPTSKVFFLQEREQGMYELYFGDNFLGQKPEVGNVIVIEYLETNGDAANGISDFSTDIASITIQSADVSSGGTQEESIEEIKFLAPKYYATQGRAVTENDYTAIVRKEYPNTSSIFVYGGETVTPPQYGKVFIALKPKSGSALTTEEKSTLVRTLRKNAAVMAIVPEIVDPDYIDLVFDTIVTYDPALLSFGEGTLKALVVAYILTYSSSSLESFGSNFYLSQIIQGINGLNPSILSNQTTVNMRKTLNISTVTASNGFVVDFMNPLFHPHDGHSPVVKSSSFQHTPKVGGDPVDVVVSDDGYGVLNLVNYDSTGKQIVIYSKIGTVDYTKGIVRFNTAFSPTGVTLLTLTVQPKNTDLFVFENKMVRVNRGYTDSVKVSVVRQSTRKENLKA